MPTAKHKKTPLAARQSTVEQPSPGWGPSALLRKNPEAAAAEREQNILHAVLREEWKPRRDGMVINIHSQCSIKQMSLEAVDVQMARGRVIGASVEAIGIIRKVRALRPNAARRGQPAPTLASDAPQDGWAEVDGLIAQLYEKLGLKE